MTKKAGSATALIGRHPTSIHAANETCTACVSVRPDLDALGQEMFEAWEALRRCSHGPKCLLCGARLLGAMYDWRDRYVTPEEHAERERLSREDLYRSEEDS